MKLVTTPSTQTLIKPAPFSCLEGEEKKARAFKETNTEEMVNHKVIHIYSKATERPSLLTEGSTWSP